MDPTGDWSRRRFIAMTADTALLASVAGALKPLAALAAAEPGALTLFDPRFPSAETLARSLSAGAALQPVHADPTDLVLQLAAQGGAPRCLRGVTPEAVPFCLRQWWPEAQFTERRIDGDLFVWTLEART